MQVLSQERVLGLIGRIYDAASDSQLWLKFLQDFAATVDGSIAILFFYDWSASDAKIDASVGFDPVYADQYVRHYYSVDPWIEAWKKRWNRAGPETIETSDQNVELTVLAKTEFYHDLLIPLKVTHQVGCMLTKTDHRSSAFTCLRPRKRGPFGTAELTLLRILFPHLERALTFHSKMAELQGRHHASLDALDCLQTGVILLDDHGRILTTNREADRLLRQSDGLSSVKEGISAAGHAESLELNRLIAGAAATARCEGTAPGGLISLTRPSGKRPLSILVTPVGKRAFAPQVRTPAVVVFVTDPESKPERLPRTLARLYQLTTAESRLAELLMQGETVVRAAAQLGISHNTARTHLQRIYQKTGTTHQSDLVRILLSGAFVQATHDGTNIR